LIHYKDSRRNLSKSFNKNADISAHDAFLELPSTVTIKTERLERQIIRVSANQSHAYMYFKYIQQLDSL